MIKELLALHKNSDLRDSRDRLDLVEEMASLIKLSGSEISDLDRTLYQESHLDLACKEDRQKIQEIIEKILDKGS
tara:strand:+ start:594 stop:818 length:225 start_codon:yes stop_codon:yes gene_type:complete